jgi:hypothetical protein
MAMMDEYSDSSSLSWDPVAYSVEAICTDAAPAMLRKNSEFTAPVKKMNSDVISSHCILRYYALILKALSSH